MNKEKAAVGMGLPETLNADNYTETATGESALACSDRPQPWTGFCCGLYAEENGLTAWRQGPALRTDTECCKSDLLT